MKIIKITCSLLLSIFLIFGCSEDNRNIGQNSGSSEKAIIDTIDYGGILNNLKSESDLYDQHPVQLEYYDKNDKQLNGFNAGDTFHLKVLYSSRKFSRLSNSYKIYLEAVTNNIKILKRLDKNKFELYIKPDADTVRFDVYLGSDNFIFKSLYVDKNRETQYDILKIIGLCQKTELVGR